MLGGLTVEVHFLMVLDARGLKSRDAGEATFPPKLLRRAFPASANTERGLMTVSLRARSLSLCVCHPGALRPCLPLGDGLWVSPLLPRPQSP